MTHAGRSGDRMLHSGDRLLHGLALRRIDHNRPSRPEFFPASFMPEAVDVSYPAPFDIVYTLYTSAVRAQTTSELPSPSSVPSSLHWRGVMNGRMGTAVAISSGGAEAGITATSEDFGTAAAANGNTGKAAATGGDFGVVAASDDLGTVAEVTAAATIAAMDMAIKPEGLPTAEGTLVLLLVTDTYARTCGG